jgi:TPR repeat protein
MLTARIALSMLLICGAVGQSWSIPSGHAFQGSVPKKASAAKQTATARPPVPGSVQAAVDAYLHGDFTAALAAWRALAEGGNVFAQSWVGQMYERGEGTERDYGKAAHY